jgi:hypothetical protein
VHLAGHVLLEGDPVLLCAIYQFELLIPSLNLIAFHASRLLQKASRLFRRSQIKPIIVCIICETSFFQQTTTTHGSDNGQTMHPHQWAKKSKKTLWRHALGFLFWTQNFYLLVTSWVSLNLSIWNMQQPLLLCCPSTSWKPPTTTTHTHLYTFSLWYATVCIAVVCDFAGTISNYASFVVKSLSLL